MLAPGCNAPDQPRRPAMKWSIAMLLAGAAAGLAASADPPRPNVRVMSIEAQRKVQGELGKFAAPGVKLEMQLRLPGVTVVDVDAGASKGTELVDDQKTDLLDGKSTPFTIAL